MCGFGKIAVLEALKEVNYETFNKGVLELQSTFNKWNPRKRLKERNSQLRTGKSYLK